MPDIQGALAASLDDFYGPWAGDRGWQPFADFREDADIPPPAAGDMQEEVDASEGHSASVHGPAELLPVLPASEDVFRFGFAAAGRTTGQVGDAAATESVTLDQIDIAALLAGGEAVTFLADWDFGVVTVQVQASDATPTEDGGPGFEIVLSAIGSPEVNDAWL